MEKINNALSLVNTVLQNVEFIIEYIRYTETLFDNGSTNVRDRFRDGFPREKWDESKSLQNTLGEQVLDIVLTIDPNRNGEEIKQGRDQLDRNLLLLAKRLEYLEKMTGEFYVKLNLKEQRESKASSESPKV
jgi:hypothetical protein